MKTVNEHRSLLWSVAGALALLFLVGAATEATAEDKPAAEATAAEAAPEAAAERPAPTVADPLPFDHGKHEKRFKRLGLTCIDCHPVGLSSKSEPELPPAPRSVCHGCHRAAIEGAPKKAKSRCERCHTNREELKPETHLLGWIEDHGAEARALRAGCDDCHDRGQCIDCHDARGALTRSPHAPGFGTFHGVEARLDPAGCVTCHAEETCVRCHETGRRPL